MSIPISKSWYREPWPWLLMAGPFIVVVAGFVTLWLAASTDDGLVADDYYKQGKEINMTLERDHLAQKLGLQAHLTLGDQGIRVMLKQTEAAAKWPPILTLRLIDPTRAGQDKSIPLQQIASSLYSGDLPQNLRRGRWYVSLEDHTKNWRLTGEWRTDESSTLQLKVPTSNNNKE